MCSLKKTKSKLDREICMKKRCGEWHNPKGSLGQNKVRRIARKVTMLCSAGRVL